MKHWEDIRLRCVRDREPIKRVARDLGLSPNTVRKYCAKMEAPEPPSYERQSKLDPFVMVIDALLESTPKITAKRIGAIIRQQYDPKLSVSESALRKYVARRRRELNPKEAFVRAQHVPADQAQFDFSPMEVIIAGVLTIVHVFAMRLSYSGAFFARASFTEDRPALFAGLLAGIKFFGGLPRVAIFDNPKTAVQRILRGRNRVENDQFRRFCGELALKVEFAAPSTTPGTMGASTSCGPYSVPAATLYCTSANLGSATGNFLCTGGSGFTAATIYVSGGNSPFPGSSTYFWANAGIGSQFLNVAWNNSMLYVASLAPSQPFTVFIWC